MRGLRRGGGCFRQVHDVHNCFAVVHAFLAYPGFGMAYLPRPRCMSNRDHWALAVLAVVRASIDQHTLGTASIPGLLQMDAVRGTALLAEPAGVMNHKPLGWLGVAFPLHHWLVAVVALVGCLVLCAVQVVLRWFHSGDLRELLRGVLVPAANDPGL